MIQKLIPTGKLSPTAIQEYPVKEGPPCVAVSEAGCQISLLRILEQSESVGGMADGVSDLRV